MKYIPLTNGKRAIVDDEDFYRVSFVKWHYLKSKNTNGYATRSGRVNGRLTTIRMHHVVFGRKVMIDHINGNGLDNRRTNLRECTHQQNCANRQPSKNMVRKMSPYRGVGWDSKKSKWKAFMYFKGKAINLGWYKDEKDAAIAVNAASQFTNGHFAYQNRV